MPANKKIKKVLMLGSGPIVIGQGAEFDYSGTQCCEALREEGLEVVLLNSNPATIMTDKEMADKIYIEPMNCKTIEKILEEEGVDGIIASMGGQTALNLGLELHEKGILEKYKVPLLGTGVDSIIKGEDRQAFKNLMESIGEPIIESYIAQSLEEALAWGEKITYPVIVRPAYTLGGAGGGIAENEGELKAIAEQGLAQSPVHQILVEKSIKGWKEVEYEIVRDSYGNAIAVCNMENLDPVGIHTGDSIVVAPSQTLSDREYQMLRHAAIKIVQAVGVEGACNVQFALHPESFEYGVIEINPRVSRSSALASKATGYPIAKVAAKIAMGYGLDEIKNQVTGQTYACFEPSLDYIVVKIPKWPFDKFKTADRSLGTKMMATGEVMAIGNNFRMALLKGIRGLEINRYRLTDDNEAAYTLETLKGMMTQSSDERLFALAELFKRGYSLEKVREMTKIDRFFLAQIQKIVQLELSLTEIRIEDLDKSRLIGLKKEGFADRGIAELLGVEELEIRQLRKIWGIQPVYKMVDTCSAEFEALSPYYYASYDKLCESRPTQGPKVVVVGSGPIRIGQGIEFDYASVHAVQSLKKLGYETIMINNNPETVSTDFNIAHKLYFEPITAEDVLAIVEKEKPLGVLLQFGGQTAIKLAEALESEGIQVLGTNGKQIAMAEDRDLFDSMLEELALKRPQGKAIYSVEEGIEAAKNLGFPLVVRPSFVLGGQGMEISYDETTLANYLANGFKNNPGQSILIDQYLNGKELEIDAVADGEQVLIVGIMEHIEKAGIHSGDSMSYYPAQFISQAVEEQLMAMTAKIAKHIGFKGMMNIQFIAYEDELYIIEVNLRASRTVPYLSKISGLNAIDIAVQSIMGKGLKGQGFREGYYEKPRVVAVKMPIFSTVKLKNVEVSLGPEMKSTGEILGIGENNMQALCKGFEACGLDVQLKNKNILLTLRKADQLAGVRLVKLLLQHNVSIYATEGTGKILEANGLPCRLVTKEKGRPDSIESLIEKGELDLIVNTPTLGNSSYRDGFLMRRKALEWGVPMMNSLEAFETLIDINENIEKYRNSDIIDITELA